MNEMKLLFIHGAGGTKSKWRAIAQYMDTAGSQMIDLPGHGENECNVITSVQDYAAYLDRTIQEDTVVIGHSMGGLIALELAARNQKVKGVVLAASFYELPVHEKMLQRLASGEFPNSLFLASYSKETSEKLLEEERQELDKCPIEIAYADFKICDQYKEGKETIASLSIPVCAILGEEDRLLPPNAAEALQAVCPDLNLVRIPASGHYIMLEQPEMFAKELMDFVQHVQKQTV
ncbi:pimeloyl-ACP methyl ester carboxylesterase [Bacillus ectoiniformans]|uniref:alpha/beta fold hydrolase n=1 Tax=Bacillus ectoiniformans TaxID=1494429 RepID=UPI0019598D75|nr:alpha/beta hydrolase [Bacillus ectoiniformans]MBM7649663.1 pimeloyl-ACP methyl ester carboxylesterase [Bacillus ectoiniformans]